VENHRSRLNFRLLFNIYLPNSKLGVIFVPTAGAYIECLWTVGSSKVSLRPAIPYYSAASMSGTNSFISVTEILNLPCGSRVDRLEGIESGGLAGPRDTLHWGVQLQRLCPLR
jgi:hypothetical protein